MTQQAMGFVDRGPEKQSPNALRQDSESRSPEKPQAELFKPIVVDAELLALLEEGVVVLDGIRKFTTPSVARLDVALRRREAWAARATAVLKKARAR